MSYNWNFDPCGKAARRQGPVNPSSEHFKGQSKIHTLVRETLQNSLDAALHKDDPSNPVQVTFSFDTIKDIDSILPNFVTELKKHIKACDERYHKYKIYEEMLDFISKHPYDMPIIRVSDRNTKGMVYDNDNPVESSFYGYLIADGAHVDHGGNDGGGSFGIGKMASFDLSSLNTVLVSTYNKEKDQHIFQGATILCSHKVDDTEFPAGGFYDCNDGEPVTDLNKIPKSLIRNDFGTDVMVIGVENNPQYISETESEIAKAVLINFWPAIYHGTLEVTINKEVIKAANLDKKIRSYFTQDFDNSIEKVYENPLPYYLAVKECDEGKENCRKYGDNDKELKLPDHPTVGSLSLYIRKNRKTKDRIIATRKPRMVIQWYNRRNGAGYSAVLICHDENGNRLLRLSEPPAHNKWDAQFKEGKDGEDARKALDEIENYIKACVQDFFASEEGDECDIEGLSELLKSHGDKNAKSGAWTTQQKKKLMKVKQTVKPTPIPNFTQEGGEGEEPNILGGGEPEDPDGPTKYPPTEPPTPTTPGPTPPTPPEPTPPVEPIKPKGKPNIPVPSNGSNEAQEIIDCQWRPLATMVDGHLVCRIKLTMPKAIENGDINVYIGSADGKIKKSGSDKTNIQNLLWAKVNGIEAKVVENTISSVALNHGLNTIDFRFPNNNRYKLYIEIISHIKK